MKFAILLAWIVGSTLTTASATPSLQDESEKTTARLVEILNDLGYVGEAQATQEREPTDSVPPIELGGDIEEEEEEIVEELGFDPLPNTEEDPAELFFTQTSEQRLLIGIYTQEPTEILAYHLGVDQERAIVITNTVPGYPAAKAGLETHDVIVGIEGQPNATLDRLRDALDHKQPGEDLWLTVVQRGQRREVRVPLFLRGAPRGQDGNFAEEQEPKEEWVIEEEAEEELARNEQRYVREVRRLERIDRELRNQAMRAEVEAQRAELLARRAQLDEEIAAMSMETKLVREEVRAQLLVREAQLRAEMEGLEGAIHEMEAQMERLEGELSSERRARPRYRQSRERGARAGALFFDESEDEEEIDTMIIFGEDDEYWWRDGEEEDEEDFGEEVLDRMEEFEDRLERIEDLLLRLVERNR